MKKTPSWVTGNPAIEKRIVHIDLKGPKIPLKSLTVFLQMLARWGINGVLVEYEHRLPYLPLKEQFPSEDRYTKNQLKQLIKIASDSGIEWIPLVQTFGHVEYLSRLKGTKTLFENPEYPQQFCPLKKNVKEYLRKLVEIVCELHPESRYIHVGQDETHQLGFCPECRKAVRETGRIPFYLKHTKRVWNLVKSNGKTPLFWADMFFTENRPELLCEVDEGVIPVVWQYEDMGELSYSALIGGIKVSKLNAKHPYKATPLCKPVANFAKQGDFFEDLPEKTRKIIGTDKQTGYPKSFSQIRMASYYTGEFWGCCAVYNCSDMLFMPDFVRGIFNPVSMCKIGKELGIKGIIASSWARAHSFAPISPPWTLTLYNIAHFSAAAYSGETSTQSIRERMPEIAEEIGMQSKFGEFSLDDILWVISNPAPGPTIAKRIRNLECIMKLLREEKFKGDFGKSLFISTEAELLFSKLLFLQEEARWWTPMRKDIPHVIIKEMEQRFTLIKKQIKQLEKISSVYYTKIVGDRKSFDTWWKGLFELDIHLAEKSIKFLRH